MGLFQQNIDSGNLQIASTNSRSNRTDNLRTWKTVTNYYRSVYQEIKDGSDKALNTIKKLSDNSYQLKSKYARELISFVEKENNSLLLTNVQNFMTSYHQLLI